MVEIELSIMDRSLHPIPDIKPTLEQFEAETNVHVNITVLEWDTAWSEILKTALYQHGPDISEIGSTWVSSLVGMNSLRSFSNEELTVLGAISSLPFGTVENWPAKNACGLFPGWVTPA